MHKFHSKSPPKVLLEVKNNLKSLLFQDYFSTAETVECIQNNLSISGKFERYTLFSFIFSGSECARLTQSSHQKLFLGAFLRYYSISKTKERNQNNLRVSD